MIYLGVDMWVLPFLTEVVIFVVLGMTSDFQFLSGHFDHYVMRFWILHTSFILLAHQY